MRHFPPTRFSTRTGRPVGPVTFTALRAERLGSLRAAFQPTTRVGLFLALAVTGAAAAWVDDTPIAGSAEATSRAATRIDRSHRADKCLFMVIHSTCGCGRFRRFTQMQGEAFGCPDSTHIHQRTVTFG